MKRLRVRYAKAHCCICGDVEVPLESIEVRVLSRTVGFHCLLCGTEGEGALPEDAEIPLLGSVARLVIA